MITSSDDCPFCDANCFGAWAVASHVLRIHSRVVAQLFLEFGDDAADCKCSFCGEHCSRNNASEFASHIRDLHFLTFMEVFREQFVKSSEMRPVAGRGDPETSRKSCNMLPGPPSGNCFDFASMKKQLCEMNERRNLDEDSHSGVNLKYKKVKLDLPLQSEKAKVCRVLQFDIADENKENSVLAQNINSSKQITFAEHSLLCHDNVKEQMHFLSTFNMSQGSHMKPLHSSTPKSIFCDSEAVVPQLTVNRSHKARSPHRKSKWAARKVPTFKSYLAKKDFIYQCGKCKKLFQENADLLLHVKAKHKIFILNLVHPCYQCAICYAKFYRNRFLKKHINLHMSARKLS